MANAGKRRDIVWIVATILATMIIFIVLAGLTIYIDPLFHYHAPLRNYAYPLNNERYQNDGITRKFEYEGIITGSSMTENFMTSEAEDIFDVKFIKVPFAGGHYKEINDNLLRGYDSGKEIKYVIYTLDYSRLFDDKNSYREDMVYPTYLYNDNLFDDINYVLNKSILFEYTRNVMKYTRERKETTSFDEYSNWNESFTFGADSVLSSYTLGEESEKVRVLTEEEKITILGNIRQNVTELAYAHPETTFYLFFPPYSICYWDTLNNQKEIDYHIDAEQIVIEELLKCPNIKFYSFSNNFDLVCDLDNYKDQAHYGEWVNSRILNWMHEDKYLITADNYKEYIETIRDFYNSYDYSLLHG